MQRAKRNPVGFHGGLIEEAGSERRDQSMREEGGLRVSPFSRREFLYLASVLPFVCSPSAWAAQRKAQTGSGTWQQTLGVLGRAYQAEMTAHEHYVGYTQKALEEELGNVAYLFHAFSISEKVHAENYQLILKGLGTEVERAVVRLQIADSRTNLRRSAIKELEKIKSLYPDFLRELEGESHEDAIVSCMYSWKSHRQHEQKIKELTKYKGFFVRAAVSRIERVKLDFHICMVCGATLDREPTSPCDICNRSLANYRKVEAPA